MSQGTIMSILSKVTSKIPEVEQIASYNINKFVDKTDDMGMKLNNTVMDTVMDMHSKKTAFLNRIKTVKQDILSKTINGISEDMEEMVQELLQNDLITLGDGDFDFPIVDNLPIIGDLPNMADAEILEDVRDFVRLGADANLLDTAMDRAMDSFEAMTNLAGDISPGNRLESFLGNTKEPESFSKSLHQYTFGETVDREAFTGETDIETLLDDFFKRVIINKTLSMDAAYGMGYANTYDSDGLSQVVRTEIIPPPAFNHKDRPLVEVVNVYNNLKKDAYGVYGSKFSPASHKELYEN